MSSRAMLLLITIPDMRVIRAGQTPAASCIVHLETYGGRVAAFHGLTWGKLAKVAVECGQ